MRFQLIEDFNDEFGADYEVSQSLLSSEKRVDGRLELCEAISKG